MRVDAQSAMDKVSLFNTVDSNLPISNDGEVEKAAAHNTDGRIIASEEQIQRAIQSINEFIKVNHSELKYMYHEELGEYYIQLINSDTEEVVREIPPKKLLDVYYEMQKLAGIIIDKKI